MRKIKRRAVSANLDWPLDPTSAKLGQLARLGPLEWGGFIVSLIAPKASFT